MLLRLGIYENCESAEPTKVYECRRLLYGVSKKALALAKKAENKTFEEQEALLVELLQAIFPNFTKEELEFIDPNELEGVIATVKGNSSDEVGRVEKN